MNLPVPVFLFVAETSSNKLYFAPIKHQVRNQYSKYLKQGSLSFALSEEHSFADETGLLNFIICYIQEKTFRDLKIWGRGLISMARPWRIEYEGALYHVFSRGNNQQDIFVTDDDRYLFLETIGQMSERFDKN
jgi:hypothetical protein